MEKDFKQQPSQIPGEPTEEKLEFLKREEVRTMAKDTARIREETAKKERERIANFKEARPRVVLSQQPSQEEKPSPKKQPLIPRRPLKRSEKLFIRFLIGGIILFLLFNAAALGFWYFFKREAEPKLKPLSEQVEEPQVPTEQVLLEPALVKPQPDQPQTSLEDEPASSEDSPEAKTPVVFFEAPEQKLFLKTKEELLLKLRDFLDGAPTLGFTNLVVEIKKSVLSPQEFLQGTKIAVPQELREKFGENRMLFSYVTENKKRLGFLIKLRETEGVSGLLQSWEQSMEQDLASFFDIIGGKGSAYTPFFRSSVYQETPVRFQTFSVIDFGIVYGVIDDKLLLTSSFESFKRAVDQLKAI